MQAPELESEDEAVMEFSNGKARIGTVDLSAPGLEGDIFGEGSKGMRRERHEGLAGSI